MSRAESTDSVVDPATSPSLSRTSQLSLVSEPNTRRHLINSLEQHWPQTGDESVPSKAANMSSPNGSSPPVSQWASLYPINLPSQSATVAVSTANEGVPNSVSARAAAFDTPVKAAHHPATNGTNGVNTNGLGVSVQQLASPSIQPPTASATPLPLSSATATPAIATPATIAHSNGQATPASPSPANHAVPQPGSIPSPIIPGFPTTGIVRPPSPSNAARFKPAPIASARLQSSQSAGAAPSSSDVIQVPPLPPYEPDSNFDSNGLPSTSKHTRRPSPIPPFNPNLAPSHANAAVNSSTIPSRSPNRSGQPSPVLTAEQTSLHGTHLAASAQKSTSPRVTSGASSVSLSDVKPALRHKKGVFELSSPQYHFSWLHEPESNVLNIDEDEEEEALHRKDEEKQKLMDSGSAGSSDKSSHPHQSAAARLASKIRSGIVTKQHAQNASLHGGIYVYNVHEKMAAESLVSNRDHTEIKHLCSVYSTKFLGTRPVEIDAKSFAELRAHAAGGDRKILLAAAAGNATPGATPIAPMQVESNASKAWGDLKKQLAAQRAERRKQEEEEAAKGNCCTVFWRMLC